MTITSLLEACLPTYRIEYRDRTLPGEWTRWRSLVNCLYLNLEGRMVPPVLDKLNGLTQSQAAATIPKITAQLEKDIRAQGRAKGAAKPTGRPIEFELRITPNNVWWPYPGAKSLRYA